MLWSHAIDETWSGDNSSTCRSGCCRWDRKRLAQASPPRGDDTGTRGSDGCETEGRHHPEKRTRSPSSSVSHSAVFNALPAQPWDLPGAVPSPQSLLQKPPCLTGHASCKMQDSTPVTSVDDLNTTMGIPGSRHAAVTLAHWTIGAGRDSPSEPTSTPLLALASRCRAGSLLQSSVPCADSRLGQIEGLLQERGWHTSSSRQQRRSPLTSPEAKGSQ